MTKLFDIIPGFVWAVLLAVMTLVAATTQVRLVNERAAHEHTKAMQAEATKVLSEQARAKEQQLRQQVEKVAANAQARTQDLSRRADNAIAAVGKLRDTIDQLNRTAAPDSGSAPAADAAGQARELLGACANEYRAVAAEADGLRDQVTGLQEYAVSVANHDRQNSVQR